jgi:hypothetical protein
MKAILEFDLNDPDDRASHVRAVMADKALFAIHDYNEFLYKHSKADLTDEQYETLSVLANKFHECLTNRSIDIDKMLE